MKTLTVKELALYLGCEAVATTEHLINCDEGEEEEVRIYLTIENLNELDVTFFDVKPILRPLSDITEEEISDVFPGESNPEAYTTDFWKSHLKEYGVPTLKPEQFTYLLSRGFDLFNWIEQGLAISKPADIKE